ncbi:hypothetical protein Ddc_10277 [Ditylenchus destructor]|nr:hypothetical protein Ddc_10277 [Ditylenchus destructor]
MSRLCNLFAVIFLVDLCTISVMSDWTCEYPGMGAVEWTPGRPAYVPEYHKGLIIRNALYNLDLIFD